MSGKISTAMPLDMESLRFAYLANRIAPTSLVEAVYERMARSSAPGIWIHQVSRGAALEAARNIERRGPKTQHLYGVPFAVKDNIDVEGLPTTAGCPGFTYVARRTATVVTRLLEAGAILLGKTNLDQFATGLVGTRSPFGIPANPFDDRYITGGSSSGSAAAVARGFVTFALGTDTAGSGRVPAAFNNIVGLKPSPGLLSTTGVVPACRSLDCTSVFALTCEDARLVAEVATAFDPADAYSRREADGLRWSAPMPSTGFAFGVPRDADVVPHVDRETLSAFARARAHLEAEGGRAREIDLEPFFETAKLLYEGPWVAERLQGLEPFLLTSADAVLPITRQILERGRSVKATEVFAGLHRLQALRRRIGPLLGDIEALLLPTAPTLPRITEVEAEPIDVNTKLGRYTNFVNLLDLAAIAVPAGMRSDGLPVGVTLVGPWGSDARLLALASALHRRTSQTLGATGWPFPAAAHVPEERGARATPVTAGRIRIAVVGAHLSGQPLNHQLTERGAVLVEPVLTAPRYRLFALATTPPKPGLVRVPDGQPGFAIETEVWEMPRSELGSFFANVVTPLCLGTVDLENGDSVVGFLCESHSTIGAPEISHLGGWRRYLGSKST